MDILSRSVEKRVDVDALRTTHELRLTRWVNEPLPDVRAILTASEVSRLTRRPRWLLLGLAAIGYFPKRRTHCGKPVGWHRAEVLDWLTIHMTIAPDRRPENRHCRQARPRQVCLPLEINLDCRVLGDARRSRTARGSHR